MKHYRQWYQAQKPAIRLLVNLVELFIIYALLNLLFQRKLDWTGPLFVLVALILAGVVFLLKIKVRYAWLIYFIGGMLPALLLLARNPHVVILSILSGFIMSLILTAYTLAAYEKD